MGGNVFDPFQVGDGAGDLEDAGVGPGREAELVDGLFQKSLGAIPDLTIFFQKAGGHLGVAVDALAGKALALVLPGLVHSSLDDLRVLAGGFAGQVPVTNGRDFNVDIDAVHERAGDPGTVAEDLGQRTGTLPVGVRVKSAGASMRDSS